VHQERRVPQEVVQGLQTTSAKIRALAGAGFDRAEIAAFLGIRYQHVRKVLLDAGITDGLRRHSEARPLPTAFHPSAQELVSPGPPPLPTNEEFRRGYLAFQNRERRDAMYKTASFLVGHFWGKPAEITDGLGVLLLTWNQALYRYGSFNFQLLEKTVTANWQVLQSFRNRGIFSYTETDDPTITALFEQFLAALKICEGKKKGTASPVAVAKTLHLLAPAYFPLWDDKIAKAYGCRYAGQSAAQYVAFLRKMKRLAEHLGLQEMPSGDSTKTGLKLLDEYNYARYTKRWV